ncbi:MAG TPA: hypothetical protein H9717_01155 [Candidatus Eisenbergiella merdipullorum]|uniref:Uncharacterized protein n=1 Tax=Candidatus Eisenbergiella merdipullorum TaxID=2838553 RepID=A0A9D2KYW8_9FIRM|nr:hypothetical protein [Candidatus Eisenbergiella merdipullorum]
MIAKKSRKMVLSACLILLLALLPSGALQIRAAEVIATVYGTILSGTTEDLLLLSTAQGRMEIKLDPETDASACKVLLPGREIYVAVTYGSDGYLHAAKITTGKTAENSTIDHSTSVTVTGEIGDKTTEDMLYLNTPQGEMQIKLDADTNMNGCTVLVAGKKYQVSCARGSDAWLHAVSISDASTTAVTTEVINGVSVTTVKGKVMDQTKDDLLYLSTEGGVMQIVIDSSTDTTNGRVLVPGRELTVSFYRGSDAYLHASRIVGEKEAVTQVSVNTDSQVPIVGTVDGKSNENVLYLSTSGGMMELKLDALSNMSNCMVLTRGKQILVYCAYGSDAYMHAVSIIGI